MMYTGVMALPDEAKSIRLPLGGERLRRWENFLDVRAMEQQEVLHRLIDWFLDQRDLVQVAVLRHVAITPELEEMLVRDLSERSRREGGSGGTYAKRAAKPKPGG